MLGGVGSIGTIAYDIIARDKTGPALDSVAARSSRMAKVAGTAMTGIGAAMLAMTASARETNAEIKQTALQLGVADEEMRALVLSTTNVTFPISEVTASFDLLTRAGMRNKDEIAATATAFDTLGDAIGLPASQVIDVMIPAFNAFGIELTDAADYTDYFTHLTRNTTVELADFSSMMNYLAADLGTMNLGLVDSVAVLEALAAKGVQGGAATREFRKAVTEADGDVTRFYAALGLTEETVAKYASGLDNATGMTQQYAAAANTQYSVIDKMKQSVAELTLKYGTLLTPLEAMGPVMTALGPVIIALSASNWALATSIKATTISLIAQSAAFFATPLGWVVLAIGGVITVLYILEKKFGLVTKAVDAFSSGIHRLIDWFQDKLEPAINLARRAHERFGDKLLFLLGPIGAVAYGVKKLWEHFKTAETEADKAAAEVEQFGTAVEQAGQKTAKADRETERAATLLADLNRAFEIAHGGVAAGTVSMDEFTTAMGTLHPEIREYESLLRRADTATDELADAQRKLGDSEAEVDRLTSAYDDLARAMGILNGAAENTDDQMRSIEHAEWGVKDAQAALADAIAEYGEGSDEALKADLQLRDAEDRLGDEQERLVDLKAEIAAADDEKQRILDENNVKDLEGLRILLDEKRAEYENYVADEAAKRQELADIRETIAETEAQAEIQAWLDMKAEMESNPINRRVITTYVTKKGEELPEGQAGIAYVPETEPYLLHKGERVLTAEEAREYPVAAASPAAGGGGAVSEKGGNTINITITGNYIKEDYDVRRLSAALRRELGALV